MSDMFSPEAVHVALDLETLGVSPGSIILEIGASAFTLTDKAIAGNTFFDSYLDIAASQALGFTEDAGTREWWATQDPTLKASVFSGTTPPVTALANFHDFLHQLGAKENIFIWANSPSFDCTLLKAYYTEFVDELPWDFRNERDLRTLAACFPARYQQAKAIYKNPQPHNGYWDARYEGDIISHILKGDKF